MDLNQQLLSKLQERTRIDKSTGCWLYTGGLDDSGYGILVYKCKHYRVHRLSAHIYLELNLDNKTKHALHKTICPNKNCWNFQHLYIGDDWDNQRDKKIVGDTLKGQPLINKEKIQCINGHPLHGDNLYIPKDGRRRCNICRRENTRKHDLRKIELTRQKFNPETQNINNQTSR